jgi:hypothetical protein
MRVTVYICLHVFIISTIHRCFGVIAPRQWYVDMCVCVCGLELGSDGLAAEAFNRLAIVTGCWQPILRTFCAAFCNVTSIRCVAPL